MLRVGLICLYACVHVRISCLYQAHAVYGPYPDWTFANAAWMQWWNQSTSLTNIWFLSLKSDTAAIFVFVWCLCFGKTDKYQQWLTKVHTDDIARPTRAPEQFVLLADTWLFMTTLAVATIPGWHLFCSEFLIVWLLFEVRDCSRAVSNRGICGSISCPHRPKMHFCCVYTCHCM